jgi:hypothetical protein
MIGAADIEINIGSIHRRILLTAIGNLRHLALHHVITITRQTHQAHREPPPTHWTSQATSNPAKLTLTLLNSSAWHFLDASRLLNGLRNMD